MDEEWVVEGAFRLSFSRDPGVGVWSSRVYYTYRYTICICILYLGWELGVWVRAGVFDVSSFWIAERKGKG